MTQVAREQTGEKLLYTAKVHTAGGRENGAAADQENAHVYQS